MAKPWEKYSETTVPSKPWERYAGSSEAAVSQLESAGRGLAQGASLGFADEAAGALSNIANKFSNTDNSLFDSENYAKARDDWRAADKAAQAANPNTYLAGQVGGGVALPLGPIGLAKGALLGATQGLGSSEADSLGGAAADTALGAGLGGALGAAAPSIGRGISKVGNFANDALEGTSDFLKGAAGTFANRATNSGFGREALDSGAIKLGDTAGDIAGRLGSEAPEGLRQGVTARAAKEAGEGFFSDADKMAMGTSLVGGPHAAASVGAGIVGKNLANTRGASTGAVSLDKIGDILAQTPQQLGKFAAPLQAAQARGALNPTLFILQQTNPEFRKMVLGNQEDQ